MLRKIVILFSLIIFSANVFGNRYTISGIVKDANSGESLPSANIYETTMAVGINSNSFGYFSMTLPSGEIELMISFLGYETQLVSLVLLKDTVINVLMTPQVEQLDEVAVYGNRNNKVKSTQMSMIDLPMEKFQRVPVIMGEPDVLKVLQLLPGVQSGTEASSGIHVRGGSADQNLFLLDGVPVYNASHLFGFFSVFHPSSIKSVKLYKAGFPARYAGRLSSVVDISMKEGNMIKTAGEASVGLIASSFCVEGPIKTDKTSFLIAGRRTYLDVLTAPFIAMSNKGKDSKFSGGYYFYDFNAKLNHIFSNRSRLYLSGYFGDDGFRVKDDWDPSTNYRSLQKDRFGWGNKISALRWNYVINNKLFSNTTLTYSNYHFYSKNKETNSFFAYDYVARKDMWQTHTTSFNYFSDITDLSAKVDFDYFLSPGHTLKFGANYTRHRFKPGVNLFSSEATNQVSINNRIGNKSLYSNEYNFYLEDDFELLNFIGINAGLNLALYNVDTKTYFSPQPRVSCKFQITDDMSVKGSYARMAQFVHLLTSANISLPTDIWVPVTERFAPPTSDQYAVGWAYNLNRILVLTIEGYYKEMHNLLEYKDGASFASVGQGWEDLVEQGTGTSIGGEVLLEKNVGKTTGWVSYTLSKTDRQFENLNFGKSFPYKFDRRHDFSLVMTHERSKRFDWGATLVYSTGNAITLGVAEYDAIQIPYKSDYEYDSQYSKIIDYNGRNSYRAPGYMRADVGANFRKQKKYGVRTWNISVYNITNRKNPLFLRWIDKDVVHSTTDNNGMLVTVREPKRVLTKYSFFPIIPSVSYSYKF
ncbi:TonB-dependent receptor [Natronoflexus pectinivorans]|uniref:Outer membrane receptor protein involved in Fe transport n=1 Tax=Natronoflexus pectinivorans TaxID=682526 RepID=A0A4R2GMI7_9BACT|nr:TonB-dependent receptor [Natronoflexus pectinivorans]TCO10433.1 outer membrane receptor protein involved in Fe transport [Natronoflexus pectinivorans]